MTLLEMPDGPWWEWEILSLNRGRLILAGSFDLSYYHQIEIAFTDVAYLSCAAAFCDPAFREPTEAELHHATHQNGMDVPPVVVAFDHDFGRPVSCVIAAGSVEITTGMVHRVPPQRLEPGDRLAPWLEQPP
ncbi:hypothetical protein AB0M20_27470 [Actinoplanes sp. NPDC051633]|uniref:hypothetical protein n=1 Tax=Actinoplanes sp. NPDC051633 TaxID=3155670 RepID=UPI00343B2140